MSPFDSPQTTADSSLSMSTSTSPSGGDALLKWGHRKRSRLSRAAIEDSSSSVHTNNRRITHTVPPNLSMPPPPLVSSTASSGRGRKHNSPRYQHSHCHFTVFNQAQYITLCIIINYALERHKFACACLSQCHSFSRFVKEKTF